MIPFLDGPATADTERIERLEYVLATLISAIIYLPNHVLGGRLEFVTKDGAPWS